MVCIHYRAGRSEGYGLDPPVTAHQTNIMGFYIPEGDLTYKMQPLTRCLLHRKLPEPKRAADNMAYKP